MVSSEDPSPVLTMPIPPDSQWMKDYGLPLSLTPIPGHCSAVALICQKAICILDFRALTSKETTLMDAPPPMILNDLPILHSMSEDSASSAGGSRVPVQLVYEHFFKTKKHKGDQLDHLWDAFMEDKEQDKDLAEIMLSDEGMKLNCLPEGCLLLTSETQDHVLLSPRKTERNQLTYITSQLFENLGPITSLLLRKNLPSETGRVFFATSNQNSGGCVSVMSSGIITEELCTASHFSGITNLWKIASVSQSALPPILVLSFLQETRALALKSTLIISSLAAFLSGGSFIDVTSVLGLLEDEQTVFSSSFKEDFMIQVTPTRVALLSLRHLENHPKNTNEKSIHNKCSSLHDLTDEHGKESELAPRRWSFSVLNPQFVSAFRISEKLGSEQEAAESVWSLQQFLTSREKNLMTSKSLLDLNLWTKYCKKKEKGPSIALASSCEDIIVLFLTIESSLVFLGAERAEPNQQTSHPRKKIKSMIQLKSLNSIKLKELHPSCLNVIKPGENFNDGCCLCLVGTYHPSLEVFILQKKSRNYNILHLTSLTGAQLHSPSSLGLWSAAMAGSRPIPESIALMEYTGNSLSPSRTLFIGFRNGELVEYSVREDWKEFSLIRVRQIGALPVNLESIQSNMLLVYSNRSYLFHKRCDVTGHTFQKIKQINLPSDVKKCVGLTITRESAFGFFEDTKLDTDSILTGLDDDNQILFVHSDLIDSLFVSFIPQQITKINTTELVRKLIELPLRNKVLGLTRESSLMVIDLAEKSSRVIYRDPKGDWIGAVSLWPLIGSFPTTSETTEKPYEEALTPDLEKSEIHEQSTEQKRRRMSYHPSELLKMNSYFKRVRGVAAALSCCSSFKKSSLSNASTPRVEAPVTPEPQMSEIYLTLGTGNDHERPSLQHHIRRGSLKLLMLKINDGERLTSWFIEEITVKNLPDAVRALQVIDDDIIVVAMNHRLVLYKLIDQKWTRLANWTPVRDPVMSLSCQGSTVVTGDPFNGVVVYDLVRQEDQDLPEKLKHSFSTPFRSSVITQVILDEDSYAMIESGGNFLVLKRSRSVRGSERNLEVVSKLKFGMEFTSMILISSTNGVDEFFEACHEVQSTNGMQIRDAFVVASQRGALYLIHKIPKEMEDELSALQGVFLDSPEGQSLLKPSELAAFADDLYFRFS
eukprot:g5886.t1